MLKVREVNRNEQLILSGLLLIALVFTLFDIVGDFFAGTGFSHIAVESVVAVAIIIAFAMTVRDILSSYKEQVRIAKENANIQKGVAEKYKQQNASYLEGLGQDIERYMNEWKLTVAEKEVALLLIKGLLIKEIGEIRGVKEKTIRQQSLSIYKKSGLGNRSELAAFFLEDLLLPSKENSLGKA